MERIPCLYCYAMNENAKQKTIPTLESFSPTFVDICAHGSDHQFQFISCISLCLLLIIQYTWSFPVSAIHFSRNALTYYCNSCIFRSIFFSWEAAQRGISVTFTQRLSTNRIAAVFKKNFELNQSDQKYLVFTCIEVN